MLKAVAINFQIHYFPLAVKVYIKFWKALVPSQYQALIFAEQAIDFKWPSLCFEWLKQSPATPGSQTAFLACRLVVEAKLYISRAGIENRNVYSSHGVLHGVVGCMAVWTACVAFILPAPVRSRAAELVCSPSPTHAK